MASSNLLLLLPCSLLLLLSSCLPPVSASFSLFLPLSEVRSLLGLSREISYVDDGLFKENALRFPLPLSREVDQIHFVWFAKEKNKVSYAIRITTSDSVALHQPHLNISHAGKIPPKPSTWRVTLPCSGAKSASVLVTIDVTVTAGTAELDRTFQILRKKDCLAASAADGGGGSGGGSGVVVGIAELDPDAPPPHVVFAGVLLGALAVVVLIVLTILSVHLRGRKARATMDAMSGEGKSSSYSLSHFQYPQQQQQQLQGLQQQYEPVGQSEDLRMQMPYASVQDPHPTMYPPPTMPPPPLPPSNPPLPPHMMMYRAAANNAEPAGLLSDAESRVTDWVQAQQVHADDRDPELVMQLLEVDRLRLKLGQLLLEGTFGRVYQGTLLNGDGQEDDVFIKTVIAGSSSSQSQTLIKEGTALQGMVHNHIHTLLASTWDGTSPMLVYPYMDYGNLKKWLLLNNHGGFSTHVLVSLGLQMLKAMQHLHKRKILHRDIATRNCFLGDGNLLKLADGALSRDLFPSDYHCLGDNENRPVKWMPMEAIAQKRYSRSSDVWSFGVFLWELMTRAQQPFSDVDPFEMESYLHEGYRLHQPLNCPDQLYSVLASCWAARAAERATVHALYNHLQALQRQLQQYV